MPQKIAEFKNLYVSYGEGDALKGVSLEIDRLEHTAILGANGSGKSTLIKLFSNDIYPRVRPDSSKMLFGQERWSIFELKKRLGIITNDFHYYALHTAPNISCFELVVSSFFSSVGIFESQEYDAEMIESAKAAIEQVGITALSDKPLCEMSTGELRKTLIARALALRPEALLLDEPTVGLDIGAQIEFLDTVGGLSKDKTVIIITHHIEEIIPQIKKVLLLHDGTVFRYGTKQEVLTGENLSEAFGVSIEVGLDGDRYHIKRICG